MFPQGQPVPPDQPWLSCWQMIDTPYFYCYNFLWTPNEIPCLKPPWVFLVYIDLKTPRVLWTVPYGYLPGQDPQWGTNWMRGGLILTAGGLIFGAGTEDHHLWVINSETGVTEFAIPIPVTTKSTPITYRVRDRQFVVLHAGDAQSAAVFAFTIIPEEPKTEYLGTMIMLVIPIGIIGLIFKSLNR